MTGRPHVEKLVKETIGHVDPCSFSLGLDFPRKSHPTETPPLLPTNLQRLVGRDDDAVKAFRMAEALVDEVLQLPLLQLKPKAPHSRTVLVAVGWVWPKSL